MRIVITKNGAIIVKDLESLNPPSQNINTVSNSNLYNSNNQTSKIDTGENDIIPPSNLKVLDLDTNKKLRIPPEMEDKYMSNIKKTENTEPPENFLPDIFTNISKSMDLDNLYSSNNSSLPAVRTKFPLKYIISPDSYNNLEKDIENKREMLKKGKKVTEKNFRTEVYEDPKISFEKNIYSEIPTSNRNLITYLNEDTNISNKYVEKLSKYNDERLRKLNKICQKAFYYKEQMDVINHYVKKKLKDEAIQTSEIYKNKLEEMKDDLDKYKKIIQNDRPKFNYKDKYINQYRIAEKNWDIYHIERLYKKSNPPKVSTYQEQV
jgi:hypothetical protein